MKKKRAKVKKTQRLKNVDTTELVEVDFDALSTHGNSKMTLPVFAKLENAFALGANDVMACSYAEISVSTLWRFEEKFPEFLQRKIALRQRLPLRCLQTVYKEVDTNAEMAYRILQKKMPDDFGKDPSENPLAQINNNIIIQTNVTGTIDTINKFPTDQRGAIVANIRKILGRDDGSGKGSTDIPT